MQTCAPLTILNPFPLPVAYVLHQHGDLIRVASLPCFPVRHQSRGFQTPVSVSIQAVSVSISTYAQFWRSSIHKPTNILIVLNILRGIQIA
jgi:hypothetical protein